MKRLLIIGSTCVDVILRIDHLPTTGEDMHPKQQFSMGGCAYNAAQIPRAYQVELCLVTPVGTQGMFSDFVRAHLQADGFRGPVDVPGQNGCCYCLVEKSGERTFLSVHGVEYSFREEYMASVSGEQFDYTYICGLEVEEPSGEKLVQWLETHPSVTGTVVYAPGPRGRFVDPARTERLLQLHPILHLNAQEVRELASVMGLSGEPSDSDPADSVSFSPIADECSADPRDAVLSAARALQTRTRNLLIVTCGGDGVLWLSPDGRRHQLPSVPTRIVDTIGAGDAHCGAVLTGLALERSEEEIMQFANRIASEVVSQESGVYRRKC